MAAFVVYLLKSALILALLVSLFMLFMSKETFHRFNRYIMLAIVALSLFLPLVDVGLNTPLQGMFAALEESIEGGKEALSPVTEEPVAMLLLDGSSGVGETGHGVVPVQENPALGTPQPVAPLTPEEPGGQPLWLLISLAIYMIGVAFLLLRLLFMYLQVARIIARSRVVDSSLYGCKGIRLCVHNGDEKPFSWFRWVVVGESDLEDGVREILIHETAHARAGHSWDIVLADAVIILQWFNPLAWIMKSNLKDIHEFEADEAVIDSGVNARQYQLLIIKKAVGARLYSIANSFNHSLTKKRITMMCKEKSKKWRCAKALYILPVAAVAALSFSTVEASNPHSGKGNEFVANDERDAVENCASYEEHTVKPALPLPGSDDQQAFVDKDRHPEFPGGQAAMMKYFAENIKYPAAARAAGKEGKAFVQFVVKMDGSITDAEIQKTSGDASLDEEAVRVVSAMPKWTPGTLDGKPVNVKFVLPVVFELEAEQTAVIRLNDASLAYSPANAVIVVDGEILDGDLADIKEEDIESITVVKIGNLTAEDVEKYNAEGKDGVIFISTKKEKDTYRVMFTEQQTRSSDYGEILRACEQMPEFPGGAAELMQWLRSNIRYPQVARDIMAQGKIYVEFVVKADGTIADVKAVNSEYNSNNAKVSDVMQFETQLLRFQAMLDYQETELRGFEDDIAKWERESKVFEEDGVAEAILERRREELDKARRHFEDAKKRITRARSDVEEAQKKLEYAKNELDEIVVTAYKNSNAEPLTGEELLELEKAALSALCDEAVRVVKSMPEWRPGMQHGKAVNVLYTLPVSFRLQ